MNILRCIAIACAVPCWLYAQNPVSVEAFDEQGNNGILGMCLAVDIW